MIVFDNTTTSGTFNVVLRDKLLSNDPTPRFVLKMTKLDDFSVEEFDLINTSTSTDYYTFTIDPSFLEQGGYKAQILELRQNDDCIVNTPLTVSTLTKFPCDPLELNAEFIVDAEAVIEQADTTEFQIYVGKARVEGAIYNNVYTYEESPTYYVYNE